MLSVRYGAFVLLFEKNPSLDEMSSVVKLIMDDFFNQSTGIIESGIRVMNYLLQIITLLLYITKPF